MNGPVICGIEDASGEAVVAVARELAKRYQLPLLCVHVLVGEGNLEQAARLLHEATAPAGGELLIETGHPADRLIELLARERDASFLVVGNHGPRSSLLGSISADVSRRAPCPVIVVPPTVEHECSDVEEDERAVDGGIVRLDFGHPVRRVA